MSRNHEIKIEKLLKVFIGYLNIADVISNDIVKKLFVNLADVIFDNNFYKTILFFI